MFLSFFVFIHFTNTDPRGPKIVFYPWLLLDQDTHYLPTNVSVPRVQCGYFRKVACGRSASIPPILEGDTDTWEEEDGGEAADNKQSRKRYRVL